MKGRHGPLGSLGVRDSWGPQNSRSERGIRLMGQSPRSERVMAVGSPTSEGDIGPAGFPIITGLLFLLFQGPQLCACLCGPC